MLWHYLSLWVWPWPSRLHLDYEFGVSRGLLAPPTTLLAILGLLGLLALGWRIRRRHRLAACAIGWFLLASSVEASFLNLELAFIHRLYLPSALLAAGALVSCPAVGIARAGPVLVLVLGALSLATITRNLEWNSAPMLWTIDLERGASTRRALISEAVELNVLGRREDAIRILGESLPSEEVSARVVPSYERAVALYLAGRYAAAAVRFDEHRQRFGESAVSAFYRGLVHMHLGDLDAAAELVRWIDAEVPGHHYARVLEASLLLNRGDPERARQMLATTLDGTDPARVQDRDLIRMYLANVLLDLQRFENAYTLYLEAVRLDPANYFAWTQIYRMQRAAGDNTRADSIRRFLRSRGVTIADGSGGGRPVSGGERGLRGGRREVLDTVDGAGNQRDAHHGIRDRAVGLARAKQPYRDVSQLGEPLLEGVRLVAYLGLQIQTAKLTGGQSNHPGVLSILGTDREQREAGLET